MVESEEIVDECLSELEKNAIERRRKLMEMRARYAENAQNRVENVENGEQPVLLLFRSYKPVDTNANTTSNSASVREEINSLERNIADQLEASKDTKTADVLDLNTLAPKKIDWDLHRGIKDKLDKLDRRTNKAITQLIRQRMNEEGKGEESELLAAAVENMG